MISNSKVSQLKDSWPHSGVTPFEEDAGLFKTALVDMMLELIPMMRHTDRQDLVVRGFVNRKSEIDIFFAGRRVAEVGPLESQLKALIKNARLKAEAANAPPPDIEKVRLPLRAEGSWRRSLQRDQSGWETGTYHFVVARWTLIDSKGTTVTFGERPVVATPR